MTISINALNNQITQVQGTDLTSPSQLEMSTTSDVQNITDFLGSKVMNMINDIDSGNNAVHNALIAPPVSVSEQIHLQDTLQTFVVETTLFSKGVSVLSSGINSLTKIQ